MAPRNPLTLLLATLLTCALFSGCSSAPETPEPDPLGIPAQRHVRHLQLGVPLQGVALAGPADRNHRYYVSVPKEGLLNVRVSWHDVEGVERIVVVGAGEMKDTIVTKHDMEMAHKRSASRGQYYIELVPGTYTTSYDIVIDFSPFDS